MLPTSNDNQPPFLRTPFERRHIPIVVLAFVLAVIAGALLAQCYKPHTAGPIPGRAPSSTATPSTSAHSESAFWGIDAPDRARSCLRHGETWHPYDEASRRAPRDPSTARAVTCEPVEREKRGSKPRLVAKCTVAGG
jgi:hypothetical protein